MFIAYIREERQARKVVYILSGANKNICLICRAIIINSLHFTRGKQKHKLIVRYGTKAYHTCTNGELKRAKIATK